MDLFAQERKISGIVKGENDQELIIGANVIIKGTRRGREPRVNKLHARRGAADARQQKKFQLSSFDLSRSRQIKKLSR